MHLDLGTWQWVLVILGALAVGLAKTGIPGIGILAVATFALVLPARESTGTLLPLLICADIVAVTAYRRHAVWSHLWRLMPWAAAGIVIGYFALGWINDRQVQRLIGGILIALVCLQYARRKQAAREPEQAEESVPHSPWFAITMGLLAGFTTMVSNAAGPIMILYLLAMRLPKMEFIGTAAWYFLILNLFKVPFSYDLELISGRSLLFDAKLAPFALAGALCGRWIIRFIDQRLFENLALSFTLLAGLRLVF
jgi:uncharacterized membrane protein YfcA